MKEQDAEIQEFQAYLEAEAKSLNKDPKSYIENLGEDGLKKAYQRFLDWKQRKTKKAAHGLKLNYIRRLKNQCEDGEVLVYYKTGGPLGCKCMKALSGTEMPLLPSPQKQVTRKPPYTKQEVRNMLRKKSSGNLLKQTEPTKKELPTAKPIPLAKPKKVNTIQSAESGRKIRKVKSSCGGSKVKFQNGGYFPFPYIVK